MPDQADDWQPRPGEPHPVDKAFYELAIKERDYERARVDRLERQLAGAVSALRAIASPSGKTAEQAEQIARDALVKLGLPIHPGGQ
jgi:hypothetical protein